MPDKLRLSREQIAERAAQELTDGAYVNLGWGIPNLISDYLPKESPSTSIARTESWEWGRARSRVKKTSTWWMR